MIDGSRYFVYLIISLWKIAVFTMMAWGLSIYTGLLREPFTLFNNFTASFKSHGYNVTEISDVIFSGSSHIGDSLDDKFVGVLFTEDFSPGPTLHESNCNLLKKRFASVFP
jgi:hypothetical protein